MTNNNDILESDRVALEDKAGLAEIQDAIREIERLKNGGAPAPEETKEEEPIAAATDENIEASEEEEQEAQEPPEEDEEEEEEEQETAPVKENPKKLDKIWKIKKSRHKALAEKRAALVALEEKDRELAQLREMLAQVEVAGTYQYGKNVYSELDRARELANKTAAEGDTKGFIDAVSNLVSAQSKVNELEKWANSPENKPAPKQQEQYAPNEAAYEEIEREIIDDWIGSHKELQVGSKNYNKPLAESVIKYANALDAQLDAAGRSDLRFSEEYFDSIEDHMAEYHARTEKQRKNVEAANHVGGVRNSYNSPIPGKSSKPIQITLTPDEKKMCASSFGRITEKDWLKFKAEEQLKEGKSL